MVVCQITVTGVGYLPNYTVTSVGDLPITAAGVGDLPNYSDKLADLPSYTVIGAGGLPITSSLRFTSGSSSSMARTAEST